jgi:purine-binding chemotaxis protein CheW
MESTTSTEKKAYVSFKLGKEYFAVTVHKVLEVLQKQMITEVPQTASYIMGVINFRGEILPVIDTRQKFNMPVSQESKYVIIVFELEFDNEKIILGATADSVKDVMEISDNEIKPLPDMGSGFNKEFIIGMLKTPERFIMILDIDKVFSADEASLVADVAAIEI